MKVFVTGATGFVGSHLVAYLVSKGHQAKCLVHDPEKAARLPKEGVELVRGDVTDPQSLAGSMNGVDAVVHLVGIIRETTQNSFECVIVGGTRNVIDEAIRAKASVFYFQSALGTRPNARARYHQTKWIAEEMVRDSGLPFSILRPSFIFGKGDGFTPILVKLVETGPVIPIIGDGASKSQPMTIDDELNCIHWCLTRPEALGRTIEIGGPEQFTFEQLVDMTADILGSQKRKIHLPVNLMKLMASRLEGFSVFPISYDQILMLEEDNICETDVLPRVFGIPPTRIEDIYPELVRTILKD